MAHMRTVWNNTNESTEICLIEARLVCLNRNLDADFSPNTHTHWATPYAARVSVVPVVLPTGGALALAAALAGAAA